MQPNFESAPEVKALTEETQVIVAAAGAVVVKTVEQYALAGTELTRIKGAAKRLDELRTSITRPMDAAKKAVMDFFRAPAERLAAAEAQIKRAMLAYSNEQDRIRQAEQRKADEAAQRERDRISAQAAKATAAGKDEKAAALEQRAAEVVAPVIQREPPKVAGVSTREVWKFAIVDAALVPREYTLIDESKIRRVVGAMKGDTAIPGVRVYAEKALAAGAG